MMPQILMTIAAILGGLSVAAGAFASHALRDRLSDRALDIFETASRYQMYHALAMLMVDVMLSRSTARPLLTAAGFCFLGGVVIFSGSLYALSLSGIKWLGAVTPLGGAAFLVGWGCLTIAAWSYKD